MSYDIRLVDKDTKNVFEMPTSHHVGGTMPVGGYTTTEFNITYNYSWFYYHFLSRNGLRWLYGKTGKQTIKRLERAIRILGSKPEKYLPEAMRIEDAESEDYQSNYWLATRGNAGAALVPLLKAAKKYPNGIWEGD